MEFTGVTDDVPRILREADILRAAFAVGGRALDRAGSDGVVVASAVGGTLEIVRDGVTGFLVPPGQSGVFAERINDLLSDPPLRRRMGDAARTFVERSHGWDQVAEKSLEIYELALSRRHARAQLIAQPGEQALE